MELIIKNGTRKFGCFSLEQILTGMLKIIGCIGQKLVISNLWDLACCILFLLMQWNEIPLALRQMKSLKSVQSIKAVLYHLMNI